MTSIPLASVVSFLRPRGALGVLEGAPHFDPTGPCPRDLHALEFIGSDPAWSVLEWSGVSPLLYLGSSEVCPAAEGWASRVLAMVIGRQSHLRMAGDQHLTIGPTWVLLGTASHGHAWAWVGAVPSEGIGVVQTVMHGEVLSTPAERLAAVLRYELERAR